MEVDIYLHCLSLHTYHANRGATTPQVMVIYLKKSTEVCKLSEEVRHVNWEEFIVYLEHNPEPAQAWRALSGFPALMVLSGPLV